MPEAIFPKPVAEVMATLVDLFRHQNQTDIVEVLENGQARFDVVEYDNWNGGTYTWTLRLEVPVALFASIEPHLASIEERIAAKLTHFNRLYPNDHLNGVSISPLPPGATPASLRIAPSEVEIRRLWPDGRFRLFLSHVSEHRISVAKLKDELALRGVASFVSHNDIEPSLEWQREIELGLGSMHALAALITPDFHASPWTDQEVGWALGRGLLVLPIRLGTDPYGFMAKVQGISSSLEQPNMLAQSIVNALLINPQTHSQMRRALVSAFCHASSYLMAKVLRHIIVNVRDFTEEEKAALRNACTENSQVSAAAGVPDAIYNAFGRTSVRNTEATTDVPF